MTHNTDPRNRSGEAGFALIVTLTLLVLLAGIAVGLLSLSSVTLRFSSQGKAQSEARANARMALILAIGELQTLTGPDQRITASAQLATASQPVKNPHWTGVWTNSGTQSIVPGESIPKPQLLSWLVSGNLAASPAYTPDMDFNRNTPQLFPGIADKAVTLLGGGSVDLSISDENEDGMEDGGGVVAPLVEIVEPKGKVTGRYAYWVGDEGVKARINLNDPHVQAPAGSAEGYGRLAAPPRSAAELFSRDSMPTSALWGKLYRANDPVNELVVSNKTLSLALDAGAGADSDAAQTLPKARYHDYSVASASLVVDARNGGLKFDLTTATRFGAVDWSEFKTLANSASPDLIFPPIGGTRTNKDPGGPHWDVLKSFVQGGADSNGIAAKAHSLSQHGFAPVIQEFKMFCGPSITGNGAGRGIRVHYMPVMILWNPYDRILKAHDYYVVFGPMNPELNVHVGLNPVHWAEAGAIKGSPDRMARLIFPDFKKRKLPPALYRDRAFRFRIEVPDLPPGSAMVFTAPEGGHPLNTVATIPYQDGDFNVLQQGWRVGDSNYYIDCGPMLEGGVYYKTAAPKPLEEDDVIYHLSVQGQDGKKGAFTDLWMGLSKEGVRDNPVSLLNNSYMYELSGQYMDKNKYQRVTLSGSPTGSPLDMNNILDGAGNYIADPVFGYWLQLRMCEQTASQAWEMTIPFLRSYNPRGPIHAYSYIESRSSSVNNSFRSFPTYFRGLLTLNFDSIDNVNANGNFTYPGFSPSSIIGERHVAFRAFESDTGFFSIGDLMHANLIPDLGDVEANLSHKHIGANYPAYAVGSSAQSPYIEKDSTVAHRDSWPAETTNPYPGGLDSMFYDLPYLLNEALWDRFYFSTMNAAGIESHNPRYRELSADGPNPYDPDDARSFAASHAILGGFNVNSTSVDAWAAVLGAYLGIPSESNPSVPKNQSLMDRVAFPEGASHVSGQTADADSAWGGSRRLDATEIRALAKAIVGEVRSRGPFLSLADFVNRNLKDAEAGVARQRGALDAAIKAAGLNDSLAESVGGVDLQWDDDDFPKKKPNQFGLHNMEALTEPITDHIPGALSQPDLLAKFGSILTVRSDTFTVRFYGDALDPATGRLLARAWGEATVQRVIEPMAPSSLDGREPSDQTRDSFGRRYEIIGLRWLNPNEI